MKNSSELIVTTPSDREIVMSRVFDAPRRLVFDAYTKCEYVKRWLCAFEGWSLDVCTIDLKVGGSYRYEWRNTNGTTMAMGGVYREIVTGERIVATEKFDEAWYEGEGALDTTTFHETDGKTTLTLTVLYASKTARDEALKSGATEGLSANYVLLDEVLAKLTKGAAK
jgi:uncharacterized protein YndB with AHSA1/START domain